MTDRNFPAFPRQWDKDGNNGMTLRDYFAGQVVCGTVMGADNFDPPQLVKFCYAIADEMLKAREVPLQEPPPNWHDAPTCPGLWVWRLDGISETLTYSQYDIDEDLLEKGGQFFGPIPEDTK